MRTLVLGFPVTVTVTPGTGSPAVFMTVTEIRAWLKPSAGAGELLTVTVDAVGEMVGGGGAEKTTTAVAVMGRVSVVSVAAMVTDSAVRSVTVNLAWPVESVTEVAVPLGLPR